MASKLKIFEKCERCGGRNARQIDDRIVEDHYCPYGPPGPQAAPRTFTLDKIEFVRGEFSTEFLSSELRDAWSIIDDLRKKRWSAERAVTAAVQRAFLDIYDPGRPVPPHGSGP